MRSAVFAVVFGVVTGAVLAGSGCGREPAAIPRSVPDPPDLEAIRAEFRQEVVRVTEGVYVAVGFGLANCILLEGDDGVVIVDAMESRSRAEAVRDAFREITRKPVRALILTHNHADHVFGGLVFTEGREDVPVYAHASLEGHLDEIVSVLSNAIYVRSMRMFGQKLPESARSASGIGLDLDFDVADAAIARPTHTFEERLRVEIAGLRLELIHAPGETPDQIMIWLEDKRTLLPADNIYRAFPNLYTIRGTAHRDVMAWVRSLDAMRDLAPEHLVPSHTRPISGAALVQETLTAYRDGIQFLHDQTVRGLNQGRTPDELAATLHLPPHLAEHPFLQPYYGDIAFSVRGICAGYLGWFGGDAADLEPLAPAEASRRMFEAFARGEALPDQALGALAGGDYRWAAQLARHWVRHEPGSAAAREALAGALEGLAGETVNFNARNYYLTQAMEWRGELEIAPQDPARAPDSLLEGLPIGQFLGAMPVRLKAEATLDVDTAAEFRFTDTGQTFSMHVRRGVAEVRERPHPDPDIVFTVETGEWKRLAAGKRNPAAAYASGSLRIAGGLPAAIRFLGYFER